MEADIEAQKFGGLKSDLEDRSEALTGAHCVAHTGTDGHLNIVDVRLACCPYRLPPSLAFGRMKKANSSP